MAKSLTLTGFIMLIILAMMWGSSFTMIKIALDAFGPASIAAGRIGLAAIVLVLIATLRREEIPRERKTWVGLFWLAILGNCAPFFLIGWGEHVVDGGMTAVLMSTIPLSVPIMAHFFTDDEKLTPYMVAGVCIGFVGLLVLVGPSVLYGLGQDILAQGAIVSAALCYGAASIVARRLSHVPFMVVAAGSMTIATLIMIPPALIIDQPWTIEANFSQVASLIYLGLFPTALANILLLQVINTSGVSFLALNNYLVPVFGIAIAALTLGEKIPPEMLTALGIIFVGIFVSNLKRKSG
ncbi:DMT family transporter [Terasakiella sp. SH-1]|uniref:DMT family transporter n=1 Tax=Terasakiella sp. SH-1 TaxID=2560057 RepID=UPI001431D51D|nr:DMT family transporter [Terasakiella sp. SH-1]